MCDIMDIKYNILREYFEIVLKRSKINDPNLTDALLNAVRETEDILKILDSLKSLQRKRTI